MMKAQVSCAGRFHAFDLVEQLFRRDALHSFTTTTVNDRLLPNRALPASLVNNPEFLKRLHTVPLPEYACYALRQLPTKDAQSMAYFVKDNWYDQRAVQYVERADLFVGWASQSLFQLREAKTRGAKTIIERGSTHIQTQYDLLQIERKKFGVGEEQLGWFDRALIEKQLKEYHEADYIMVPSEFARRSFLDRGFDPKKILKVPYGVNRSRFSVRAKTPYRSGQSFKILFVGAVGFQKGIPYLLEAVSKLRSNGLKIELTLIGRMESDFKSWLDKSQFNSAITKHIEFIPNNELSTHFQAADLFCLPSIQEGLALVIAEAMACGLPVLVTINTGGEEFIRDGVDGGLVPAGDTDALITSIQRLIDDPLGLESMSESATKRASEFSWDRYGENIIAAYQSVLDSASETKPEGEEISNFYSDYWDRSTGWTPTHSFTQEQLDLHFENAFPPSASVLDVGCGDASNYQAWLVNKVAKLSAIDISPTGVATARRMGLDAQVHDFSQRFPYEDNTFDGAVCIEVLEHLYDPKFCVQEIFRILKPGGLLVTSVPNNGYFRERLKAFTRAELSTSITDFTNEWKGAHIRFYSLYSFRRLFEVAGFKVESVKSNNDMSIFDGFDAFGGYATQHFSTLLRKKLPGPLRLNFLENLWPSLFAPHIILRVRKPL